MASAWPLAKRTASTPADVAINGRTLRALTMGSTGIFLITGIMQDLYPQPHG